LFYDKITTEMDLALHKISDLITNNIIGFSCFSYESLKNSLILAKYVKENFPEKKIIFGGIGTNNYEQELMKDFKFIDFMLMKKSEQQLLVLITCLYDKKNFQKIPNLMFRNKLGIIKSSEIEQTDINSQLVPDYDYYFNIKKKFTLQYMTSEGCINNCAFCGLVKNKIQYKKEDKVAEEINYLKNKYCVNNFCFQDDNINTNPERTIKLMNALKKTNIKWYALSSANLITNKIIKKMAEAGCKWIQFGLESGSKKVLKLMNKPIDLDKFSEVLRECKKMGIEPQLNIIMGYPGETEFDIRETLEYLYKNKENYSHINLMLFRLYFASVIGQQLKSEYRDPTQLKNNVERYNYFININNRQSIEQYISFLEKNQISYNSVFKPKQKNN
ncbi:MAG: B12-binding domain-containing radical SAM protein, partial [Nanoarchaeota archaeon]|nr:B12-binding domain-containing radical SAM protein [Nanoarchaeota archaeon]